MFKKLLVITLLALSHGVLAVDGDFSGEFRLRTNTGDFDVSNLDGAELVDSIGSNLAIRSVLGASLRPSEALAAMATLYTNFGGQNKNVLLAHANWMISDELMLSVGRRTFEIGNGHVMGMYDYDDVPYYYDGLVLTHNSESLGIDVGFLKSLNGETVTSSSDGEGTENSPAAATGGPAPGATPQDGAAAAATAFNSSAMDSDSANVKSSYAILSVNILSLPEYFKDVNVHVIAPVNEFGKSRLGLSIGGGSMGVKYSLNFASSEIAAVGQENIMADAMLGYKHELMDDQKIGLYGGFHYDGESYNAFLYDIHRFAGKLDKALWGHGLMYGWGGISYAMADTKLGLKGYYFVSADKNKNKVNEGDLELDVYLKQSMGDIKLNVWAGLLSDTSFENMSSKVEANLMMTF